MSGTGFLGRSDGRHVVQDLTPETLRDLLLSASEFVEVENATRGAGVHARALRVDGEAWQVEVRGGDPMDHLATQAANTDAAFDILRSWAADDDWWRDAFAWEPVDPGPDPIRARSHR